METSRMQPGAETSSPCRVLLVEDDLDDRVLEKRTLEQSAGIEEVVCFPDGHALMSYLQEHGFQDRSVICLTPTVIVVDVNMPRMGGLEVLRQLKSDAFLEDIPVVVVSGDVSQEQISAAIRLKADAFFRKPLKANQLRRVLDKAWRWPTPEMWTS
jgi:CheY-like chemotaxis protein